MAYYNKVFIENIHNKDIRFFSEIKYVFWSKSKDIVRFTIEILASRLGYNLIEAKQLKKLLEQELNLNNCKKESQNLITKKHVIEYEIDNKTADSLLGYLKLKSTKDILC